MSRFDWIQFFALLMVVALILPAALRLPWRGSRMMVFVAIWLGIFLAVSLVIRFFQT